MSKRKNEDHEYEKLKKRIKILEKEVKISRPNRKRIRVISSESSSEESPPAPSSQVRRSKTRDCPGDGSATSSLRNTNHDSGAPDEDIVSMIYAQRRGSSKDTQHTKEPAILSASKSNEAQAHSTAAPSVAPLPPPPPPPPQQSALPQDPTPSTSAAPVNVLLPSADPAAQTEEDTTLDDDLLEILGIDPTTSEEFGPDIQKDVAVRFEHCATVGLTKEVRKELSEKHRIPGNCKLIDAPKLNPEMQAALNESVVKRDKAIESKQKLLATAISFLGEAVTQVLALKEKQPDLLRLLIETGRILCDCQHNDSVTRRNYVLSSLKKEMKEQMKNTKIDKLLFGENLQETLKTAKAINKSGADLKATNATVKPKVNTKPTPGTSKNWRYSNRKQTIVPKNKESMTSATATKNPRASSSKTSSQRPRTTRR